MNYPTVAQLLVEFSNQVKYKLDEVFGRMGLYETSGQVLARKFKEAAKEAIKDKLHEMDLSACIKEALPVEPMYVLPSGDAFILSNLMAIGATEVSVWLDVRGKGDSTRTIVVSCSGLEVAQEMRDKILKDHLEFFTKQSTK